MKPKLLPSLLTSLIILQLPLAPTHSQSQTNPNPAQIAQAQTFTPATINGKLDSNSQTQKDKSYYNIHTFEGKEGEQITIDMKSSELDTYLILLAPDGKKIAEDDDSGEENNARIIVTLPSNGTYTIIANTAKAEETGNYTLSWREATADDWELAEAEKLNRQVLELIDQGKYDTAIPLAQQALAIRKRILGEKHPSVATSLNNLATLYQNQGRYAEAEPIFRQALAMYQELLGPKHPSVATSLNNLALLYENQGRYAEAEPLYRQALAMRQELLGPQHPSVASSLNNLAALYQNQGRYAEAEPLYRQALAITQELLGPKHPLVTTSLNNLALLYKNQGRYAEAEPLYRQALAMTQELLGSKHPSVATSLNNLAGLYQNQGRYTEAEPIFRQALAMFQELLGPKHPSVATSLNNLAGLYENQGRYAEAEPLYRQALAMRQELLGLKHPDVATSLNNLALLYRNQGRYAEAEPLYRQALAMLQELLGPQHPDVALSLNNLAALYCYQGRYAEAEPLYRQALAMRQELFGPQHPDVATSLNNLAALYHNQGRYAQAEPLFRQALAMFQEILGEKHPDIANSLNNLALLYQAKGDTTSAIKYLTQGTDIEETNLDTNLTVGSERQKQEYMATISNSTDATISLHIQAAPNNPEAARLALTTILRRKGRILDAVTDNLKLIRQNLTPENQKLLDELASTRSQLAALIFNRPPNLPIEQYQNQVANLKGKADRQEAELANRSAQFRVASQPVTIEAIQKLIPIDTALVEIIQYLPFNPKANKWEKPHYAAYILHPTGEPKWVDLGEAQPINQAVTEFRNTLKNSNTDIKPIARTLHGLLIQPILPLLGNTHSLLISPDSQLNLIPFAALVDRNNQYLVENYAITYLTTGRDLLRLQNRGESQTQPIAIANPDYDNPGDPASVRKIARNPSQENREVASDNRGLGNSANDEWTPLTATKEEAAAIIPLLNNPLLLEGKDATENALKQSFRPEILHIATHGFFKPDLAEVAPPDFRNTFLSDTRSGRVHVTTENPLLRSGLVLAGANIRHSGTDDGILTALEVTGLNLFGTKLVVLSACETGLGDVANGQGVYGLRRAFTIAGAESQVMSLWAVSDNGTKDIMVKYYQRLRKNEGRSEALRQIQLDMLHGNSGESYKHPFYWAAFIPSGDWSPMGK